MDYPINSGQREYSHPFVQSWSQFLHYDLIIFDWDGTLIDSIERILSCYRHTLEQVGLPWPGDIRVKETIGLPLATSFYEFVEDLDERFNQRLVETYRAFWLSDVIPPSTLFPGVLSLLDWLGQRGHCLAVATGKSRAGMEREAVLHGVLDFFGSSRCAGESQAKPDPDMLLQIMDETGIGPERALMIGDHVLDLEMAAAAGIAAVGVTTGSVDRKRLTACGPLDCLADVGQLQGLLQA